MIQSGTLAIELLTNWLLIVKNPIKEVLCVDECAAKEAFNEIRLAEVRFDIRFLRKPEMDSFRLVLSNQPCHFFICECISIAVNNDLKLATKCVMNLFGLLWSWQCLKSGAGIEGNVAINF